jgi:hypothetical protein
MGDPANYLQRAAVADALVERGTLTAEEIYTLGAC